MRHCGHNKLSERSPRVRILLLRLLGQPVPMRFIACLLLIFFQAVDTVEGSKKLMQLHVITRHGSRYPLIKATDTLEERTPGSLTATGQKQMYDIGVWLRQHYNNATKLFQVYDSSLVRVESSALERTIVSANSLLLGLFDETARDPHQESRLPDTHLPANIPVFSVPSENDMTIRAYANCRSYIERLQTLYISKEWKDKEAENSQLLARLGTIPAFQPYVNNGSNSIPLAGIWNVFDAIHVAKTECVSDQPSPTCQDLADPSIRDVLSQTEWEQVQEMTHFTESAKYGIRNAGNLLGSNLLRVIFDRMVEPLSDESSQDRPSFYLYSGHYPTILGVFAALGMDPPEDRDGRLSIPSYAATLVFELNTDDEDGETSVRILYSNGDDDGGSFSAQRFQNVDMTKIPFCTFSDVSNECLLASLVEQTASWNLNHWCQSCGRQSAEICELKAAIGSCDGHVTGAIVSLSISMLSGIFLGVSMVTMYFYLRSTRKIKTDAKNSLSEANAVSVSGIIT